MEGHALANSRVLINGIGRSGTSWLLKIFDMHEETFCSHEPELVFKSDLNLIPDVHAHPLDRETVREYLDFLFRIRPLRAMRKRPILRKAYRSEIGHRLRIASAVGLTLAERGLPFAAERIQQARVPDFANTSDATLVVKSVAQQLLIPHFLKQNPDVKIIYVMRHPCGNIASLQRGIEIGKMSYHYLPPARGHMASMYDFGKHIDDVVEADFTDTEIQAYRWAVLNDIIAKLDGTSASLRVLKYEDLCADPLAVARDLYDWVGLDWSERTQSFLQKSLDSTGDADGFHDLARNPLIAANKWRSTMDPKEVDTIMKICSSSAAMDYFTEAPDAETAVG